MKKYLLMISLLFISIPSTASALVRLKDVVQSGRGTQGTITMDFTAPYDKSNVSIEYQADHVSLILREAYTTPPTRRVFRSSSPESSVIRMESSMISMGAANTATVKVDVFFRIPIETVRKTSSIDADGNLLRFSYNTVAPDTPARPEEEKIEKKKKEKAVETTEKKPDGDETSDEKIEESIATAPVLVDRDRSFRASTFIFSVLRIVLIIIGALLLFYFSAYLFKRYKAHRPSVYKPKPVDRALDKKTFGDDEYIKVISSSKLDDGKKLYIVEVEGQKMLIGSSKDNLSMIAKLVKTDRVGSVMTEEQESEMKSRLKDKLRNL